MRYEMQDEIKKPYHAIMVDLWRIFIKDRTSAEYTDAWWKEVTDEYFAYRDKYKDTPYLNYIGDLSIAFLNELERVGKQ